nr:hypothetical protein [Abalone asfa-like virus]
MSFRASGLYWPVWIERLQNAKFKTLSEFYERLQCDIPKVIVKIQTSQRTFFLVNMPGRVDEMEKINVVLMVHGLRISLGEVLDQLAPVYSRVFNMVRPFENEIGFNKYKSPVKVRPAAKPDCFIGFLISFIYTVICNSNAAAEAKVYDFIRGLVKGQPIRQPIVLHGGNFNKTHLARLIEQLLFPGNVARISLDGISKYPLENRDTAVLEITDTRVKFLHLYNIVSRELFALFNPVTYFQCKPRLDSDAICSEHRDNLTNLILIADSVMTGPKSKEQKLPGYNYIQVNDEKEFPFPKLSPDQLQHFLHYVLDRPEGVSDVHHG